MLEKVDEATVSKLFQDEETLMVQRAEKVLSSRIAFFDQLGEVILDVNLQPSEQENLKESDWFVVFPPTGVVSVALSPYSNFSLLYVFWR